MTEDRLINLAIVSIEKNVVATLDLEAAIENFDYMKARKIFFIDSVFIYNLGPQKIDLKH